MTITIDDFKKLDIRLGTVKEASKIEGTDRLVKLVIDFGTETRQIVSGIAPYYPDLSVLVGKQMPAILNLEPRRIKGEESQGMVLYAVQSAIEGHKEGEERLTTLSPDEPLENGSVIR
ncbi:MAG: methionine--tRNA ligase [bacterium]|nr:methionine--tRNA ligase [bacterium]